MQKSLGLNFRAFSGIDIVTIGVLAVLFRVVGMPFYRLTSATFPYNIGTRFFVDVFLGTVAILLIRKKGTLFAYALVWWLINFIVEGEDLVWLIGMWIPMIAGEWYLSSRTEYGGTMRDAIIGVGLLYGFFFAVVYWVYLLTFYELVYSVPIIIASLAITLVGTLLGAYLGYLFGKRLQPLME